MTAPAQAHVAYLGSICAVNTIYIGHLREHPEIGPDAYSMHVRSIDGEGNQMEAGLRGRHPDLDTAVTWGLINMLEYLLSVGVDIGEIETLHPASVRGIDMDQVYLAIVADAQRMREESASSTKH